MVTVLGEPLDMVLVAGIGVERTVEDVLNSEGEVVINWEDEERVVIIGAVVEMDAWTPSSLAGMAEPTPELVKGVGNRKSFVLGWSAGDSS